MPKLLNQLTSRHVTPPLSGTSGTQKLLLLQGAYFLVIGLWAILDIDSFQLVTGPKTDHWLLRTVAALIVAASASLLLAARKPEPAAETVALAVGAAASLLAVDVIYVSAQVISPVYLLDGAAEVVLLAWWAWEGIKRAQEDDPAEKGR